MYGFVLQNSTKATRTYYKGRELVRVGKDGYTIVKGLYYDRVGHYEMVFAMVGLRS